MTSAPRKPILISGAGISALLLARYLQRSKIPFLIFEKDKSITFRAQGYRLRLSSPGLDAIEEVLGPEPNGFPKFWHRAGKTGGSQGFAALDAITAEPIPVSGSAPPDKDGKPPIQESLTARDGKIIGMSRGDMRALFLEGSEQYVRWGHQVTGYEETPNGVRAIFKDGSKSEEGEMLVGGEGIASKISGQVSQGKIKFYDIGVQIIQGEAPTSAFKGLGEGVWRIIDLSNPEKRVGIMTNVRSGDMDNPDMNFGWSMSGKEHVIKPPGGDFNATGKAVADVAKSLTANWHPRIKPIFDEMVDSEAAFWKISMSEPTGVPDWDNNPRVTVIGDAAHAMPPNGGNGASTAVRDSALLGRLLAKAGGWYDGVTADYEKEMKAYASEMVNLGWTLALQSGPIDLKPHVGRGTFDAS